eukprot:536055-Pleurochrysis_carterae.AAC.2
MIQPLFRAWFQRAATSCTTLVIAFKVLVLTGQGKLELPPNCSYVDLEQLRSQAHAVEAIRTMCDRRYMRPASPCRKAGGIVGDGGSSAARVPREDANGTSSGSAQQQRDPREADFFGLEAAGGSINVDEEHEGG